LPIKYEPNKLLEKLAPARKIKKLLTKSVTLKKAALSFLNDADFLDRRKVTSTALKVVRSYQSRIDQDPTEEKDISKDPALLIQRVQNEVITQIAAGIKEKYAGESYKWLPSDAETPDPEHQLNYGKVFVIGDGEMPGDRFGCRCGMEILVPDSRLEL
jgi:hypothetical protein